jgi:hypothetical protein
MTWVQGVPTAITYVQARDATSQPQGALRTEELQEAQAQGETQVSYSFCPFWGTAWLWSQGERSVLSRSPHQVELAEDQHHNPAHNCFIATLRGLQGSGSMRKGHFPQPS